MEGKKSISEKVKIGQRQEKRVNTNMYMKRGGSVLRVTQLNETGIW